MSDRKYIGNSPKIRTSPAFPTAIPSAEAVGALHLGCCRDAASRALYLEGVRQAPRTRQEGQHPDGLKSSLPTSWLLAHGRRRSGSVSNDVLGVCGLSIDPRLLSSLLLSLGLPSGHCLVLFSVCGSRLSASVRSSLEQGRNLLEVFPKSRSWSISLSVGNSLQPLIVLVQN